MSTTAAANRRSPLESSSTQPRKRRRRTAGGGAQDDCFACHKRGTPCDRKRPYCSQCIEIGKECSGYKTTLTWGVGVASRGKLRGLSLPVASKQNAVPDSNTNSTTGLLRRRKSSTTTPRRHPTSAPYGMSDQRMLSALPISQSAPTSFPSHSPHASWQTQGSYPLTTASSLELLGYHTSPALGRIETSFAPRFDDMVFPASASSTGSFADADFHTPIDYPHSPSSLPFPDHVSNPFTTFLGHGIDEVSSGALDVPVGPLAQSYGSSIGIHVGSFEDNHFERAIDYDAQAYGSSLPLGQLDEIKEEQFDDSRLPYVNARFSNSLFHLPTRLQHLITYYGTSVCPFLVAFDGPQNPYRMHIFQLASQNEALQNAVAALATNNMRMRRKEHRSGFVEKVDFETERASDEENCYKQMSIEQLNMQLTSPAAAQDDSVLATLLILCLFHVCDSGFSKFKTQLAGVQKLLSMRDHSTRSPFTEWVEMFFMWFDVMTATVNDREVQIKSESLDMLDYSADLGALEQFSGCEGRLFKVIAQLGGLSLLAQGRHTRCSRASRIAALPVTRPQRLPSSRRRYPTLKAVANRSLDASDYAQLDGNGWGSPIVKSDDDELPVDRAEFWNEWRDIRARLQEWKAESTMVPQDGGSQDQQDIFHISESFRHSALLYTARLAHPLLPSSAQEFQDLVSQALLHITALPVTSCVNKFLLWPLFITGTECVDAGHRAIVRDRCIEIKRESGFYNNISCLEVLEKVWADVDMGQGDEDEIYARRRDSDVLGDGESRQAFRWRRAMDRIDGEYLII